MWISSALEARVPWTFGPSSRHGSQRARLTHRAYLMRWALPIDNCLSENVDRETWASHLLPLWLLLWRGINEKKSCLFIWEERILSKSFLESLRENIYSKISRALWCTDLVKWMLKIMMFTFWVYWLWSRIGSRSYWWKRCLARTFKLGNWVQGISKFLWSD